MQITVEELIQYTDEERARWEPWFRENGEHLLRMPVAGDRDLTVGALLLHIVGVERRYVQRLRQEALTEYRGQPSSTVEQIFGFGIESRRELRRFVRDLKPDDWSRTVRLTITGHEVTATVRKIILHALLHEIRHWAQVARIMRERGFAPPGGHDLLESAALL